MSPVDRHDCVAADSLLDVLRGHTGLPHLAWRRPPERLAGGFWAEMFVVELAGAPPELAGTLVARLMPDPDVAALETAVQSWAHDRGVPVPRVRASGERSDRFDRAWMLMDHIAGAPILSGLSGPAALLQLPRLARALPDLLAEVAVLLHTVPADDLLTTMHARSPRRPHTPAAQLERSKELAGHVGEPGLAAIASRLTEQIPEGSRVALCHGDLHPFNVLATDDGPVLIDWSAATLGIPEFDVAFTQLMLANPPLLAPRPLAPPIRAAGRALARRFLARYRRLGGAVDGSALEWSTDVHALRILLDVAGWQRAGTMAAHRGHPWMLLRGPMAERLHARHGVAVVGR